MCIISTSIMSHHVLLEGKKIHQIVVLSLNFSHLETEMKVNPEWKGKNTM